MSEFNASLRRRDVYVTGNVCAATQTCKLPQNCSTTCTTGESYCAATSKCQNSTLPCGGVTCTSPETLCSATQTCKLPQDCSTTCPTGESYCAAASKCQSST